MKDKSDSDALFPRIKMKPMIFSLSLFAATYAIPSIPGDPIAARCLSLVVFIVSLWVTEALPYYTTAMLIPFLVTALQVLKKPGHLAEPMSREETADFVLGHMFNHTSVYVSSGILSILLVDLTDVVV